MSIVEEWVSEWEGKIRITHKMNAADDDRKREEERENQSHVYMANKCS